jgi:integrase
MPKLTARLTDSLARKLTPPAEGYDVHWCGDTQGFGLRITAGGARSWVAERRVNGKTVRRTLGAATGRNAISASAARALQLDISSELAKGVDRSAERREQAKKDKAEAVTFGDALRDYVSKKRRAKDGLPLKQRTVDDYLKMIEPGRERADGSRTLDGELYPLASKSIHKITAGDIRDLHAALQKRGEKRADRAGRRADYAAQVLRAVLNWHGVTIEANPLGREVAGKDRIRIAPARAKGDPIPPERVGAWWRAACAIETLSGDALRFALLTGCRGIEVRSILVTDVDEAAGSVLLRDTKSRTDHTVYLSKQAAEIVARNAKGKNGGDLLFGVSDPGKTLSSINEAAGVSGISGHGLRKTFSSVAAELLPGGLLKRLVNHVDANDITAVHYVRHSETALRAGWQAVADWIEAQAKSDAQVIEAQGE